jgi:hypothetical protein
MDSDQTSEKQAVTQRPRMKRRIRILVLLSLIFVICLDGIQRIYTPAAINAQALPLFQGWINLAKLSAFDWEVRIRHPEDAYIYINGQNYRLGQAAESNYGLSKYFSWDPLSQLGSMVKNSYTNKYCTIVRKSNKLFFIPYKPPFLPCRPGVGYSLDGSPLETETVNEYLNNIVFVHLAANWYYSKDMVLYGRRIDRPYTIPFHSSTTPMQRI